MITAVLGEPGVGKSAFLAYKIKDTYLRSGRSLLSCSASYIARLNDERGTSFAVPQRPPIYADFDVTFKTGYKKTFSPYKANGFYVGFTNENSPVQFFPPYSYIFLDEVSRYYDSRKSSSMPEWVSRFYERHRHFHLNFYLALQRTKALFSQSLGLYFLKPSGSISAKPYLFSQTLRLYLRKAFRNLFARSLSKTMSIERALLIATYIRSGLL